MQDNALIFADVTRQPQVLMESSYNILMSISIVDSIHIPANTLRQHYRNTGLVKVIFFSYKQLEKIVADYFPPRFGKVLNSRIVTATLDGRGSVLHEPVLVT